MLRVNQNNSQNSIKSVGCYLNAVFWLFVNFLKAAVLSGFSTGRLILFPPKNLQGGICEFPYQNLSGYPLALLGMMITLTPGTTMIEIDTQSQTLHLHLLDLSQKEQVFAQIQQEYVQYLSVWSSGNLESPQPPKNNRAMKNVTRG